MTTRMELSAGTGAITPPTTCTGWRPLPADPGERPRCRCGREKPAHVAVRSPRRPTAATREDNPS